jgi:hypothetical protein
MFYLFQIICQINSLKTAVAQAANFGDNISLLILLYSKLVNEYLLQTVEMQKNGCHFPAFCLHGMRKGICSQRLLEQARQSSLVDNDARSDVKKRR